LYGKPKDKKWWMQLLRNAMNDIETEAGEMMKSIKLSSDQISEIVLYHKVKRIPKFDGH
jgi:hypothetical protein